MKGIELPISTIIVIILVLIVLIAVIGLFYGVWPSGAQTATLESVKDNACSMLSSIGGCDSQNHDKTEYVSISNFDANKDGSNNPGSNPGALSSDANHCTKDDGGQDNLFTLCKCWFGITGDDVTTINDACKTQVCHCQTG